MRTRDPKRLTMLMRDKETIIYKLEAALQRAKQDNQGDVFLINKHLKEQKAVLEELKESWRDVLREHYALEKLRQIQTQQAFEAEINSIRCCIRNDYDDWR